MRTYLMIAVASVLVSACSYGWRDRNPMVLTGVQFASAAVALYCAIQWLGMTITRKR